MLALKSPTRSNARPRSHSDGPDTMRDRLGHLIKLLPTKPTATEPKAIAAVGIGRRSSDGAADLTLAQRRQPMLGNSSASSESQDSSEMETLRLATMSPMADSTPPLTMPNHVWQMFGREDELAASSFQQRPQSVPPPPVSPVHLASRRLAKMTGSSASCDSSPQRRRLPLSLPVAPRTVRVAPLPGDERVGWQRDCVSR